MTAHAGALQLLADIENTRDNNKRRALLRQACDLFDVSRGNLSSVEAEIFDDILDSLTRRVDSGMRREAAERLAVNGGLLVDTTRSLALDDKIEVARPVLAGSDSLSDDALVEVAQKKGQSHMAVIAGRPTLNEKVTDTLVELGDRSVLRTVAGNQGAQFSKPGMSQLTDRALEDQPLQFAMAGRSDLPQETVRKLLDVATAEVRQALEKRPGANDGALDEARQALERDLGIDRIDFSSADRRVRTLLRKQEASETLLCTFARQGMFAELVVTLSIMTQFGLDQAKQLMTEAQSLLIAAKAEGYSRETLKALLAAGPAFEKLTPTTRRKLLDEFEAMSADTAQRVLRFWRTRQKLAAA